MFKIQWSRSWSTKLSTYVKKERVEKGGTPSDKCGLDLCAQSEENQWFVDSGCSRHVTGDQNTFISLKKGWKFILWSGFAKISRKWIVALINGKGKDPKCVASRRAQKTSSKC